MRQFLEQIILISQQTIPNVTPVMDQRYRPEKITLCVSDRMQSRAEILEKYFRNHKIETVKFDVGDAWDYNNLQQRFMELALRYWNKRDQVAVNLTGGTKLMTLAASQALDSFYCFYVTDHNEVLPVLNGMEPPEKLESRMKLEDFFAIHGYEVERKKGSVLISKEERELVEYLFDDPKKHAAEIQELNKILAGDKDDKSLKVSPVQGVPEEIFELLEKFAAAKKISYYDDKTIEFPDLDARQYCHGIWLENYLYLQLTQLDNTIKFQDFACSLNIVGSDGARNEIDAAVLYDNNMYLIECKTANLRQDRATEILYKLDSIKDIPGMLTNSILVSYLPLDKYDKNRAQALRITVYDSMQVKDFANLLASKLNKQN